jgi:hypothetical protein
VVWLARHARPGMWPQGLALRAFGEGLAVPEATVRAAFHDAISRVRLPGHPPTQTADDIEAANDLADAVVQTGLRATMTPNRIRRIDRQLRDLGRPWAPAPVARLDAGPMSLEPPRASDLTFAAVVGMLTGGTHLSINQMGELARTMAPAGAAAPIASMMEQSWQHNPDAADRLLNPDGGLGYLPASDLRDQLKTLADTLPADELRAGWNASLQLRQWACDLCDAVEHDISAGQVSDASKEWMIGVFFGIGRVLLTLGLRDRRSGPAGLALTGLLLLYMGTAIRTLRERLPEGQYEILETPGLMPPCVRLLWEGSTATSAMP